MWRSVNLTNSFFFLLFLPLTFCMFLAMVKVYVLSLILHRWSHSECLWLLLHWVIWMSVTPFLILPKSSKTTNDHRESRNYVLDIHSIKNLCGMRQLTRAMPWCKVTHAQLHWNVWWFSTKCQHINHKGGVLYADVCIQMNMLQYLLVVVSSIKWKSFRW